MSEKHRMMKKNYETKMRLNNRDLPLNHFVQETLANMMIGMLKTLKETEEPVKSLEIKIDRLAKQADVDAHTYP